MYLKSSLSYLQLNHYRRLKKCKFVDICIVKKVKFKKIMFFSYVMYVDVYYM